MNLDPAPMFNDIIGHHPWYFPACTRYTCHFQPRPEFSQDVADYTGIVS